MRLAPLLALVLLAAAPRAQNCVPDPVPPADYYPLGVGDEWIYHVPQYRQAAREVYLSRQVLRTETVEGVEYAVDQTCVTSVATGERTCAPERRVRVAGSDAVALGDDGQERVAVEGLGLGFGPEVFGCAADLGTGPVVVGGTSYSVARVKAIQQIDFAPPALAAGIGPVEVSQFSEAGTFVSDRFEYARVGGVEYGARPVAGESGAPPAAALALTAAPNPTASALRLALTLFEAQTVTVEAFDALGRRVWQQTAALSAGAQTLTVDASAWAPGVYVVRASTATASATSRVVRR